MSELENQARPILIKMIEGRERLKLSKGQGEVLIRWATKTLMMYVLYFPEEHQAFSTEDYATFYDTGRPPASSLL
jgi:hypothetical protein